MLITHSPPESRELIDPAVVTEKAGYKRLQTEISNLEKKSCEYDDRVAKMTKELKHAGFHDKLTHEKITADAEALTAKQVRPLYAGPMFLTLFIYSFVGLRPGSFS